MVIYFPSAFRLSLVLAAMHLAAAATAQSADTSAGVADGRQAGGSSDLPNIVLLVADDLGYAELGCQGNQEVRTPHIDALAGSGVLCTQAYVTAPNCSPSRAGLFSGRVPTRFGYEFNPIGARNEDQGTGFPTSELMLSEFLHDAGYRTSLIGKWHLGGTADYHPIRRGFDEFFGFLHEGHYYAPPPYQGLTTMLRRHSLPNANGQRVWVNDNFLYTSHMGHDEPAYDANNPLLLAGQPVQKEDYLTDVITRQAKDFIQRSRDYPFFMCVTYNAVHSPLQAKNETLDEFAHIDDIHRRIFLAMLTDLDRSVGAIVDELARCELTENTLVIFLSDNGGPTKELTSSNLPLRDGKGSMYEGGLRVPFIVKWPGKIPQRLICTDVISSMDVFTTCAKLIGKPAPEKCEGQNLLPLFQDASAESKHQELFWRQGRRAALRLGSWKIVSPRRNRNGRVWELYNIDSDISESNNRAEEFPGRVESMVLRWQELDQEMAEPLF